MKKEKQVCWRDLTWIWLHLCVCPLIDHGQQPMKMATGVTLLYKHIYYLDSFKRWESHINKQSIKNRHWNILKKKQHGVNNMVNTSLMQTAVISKYTGLRCLIKTKCLYKARARVSGLHNWGNIPLEYYPEVQSSQPTGTRLFQLRVVP